MSSYKEKIDPANLPKHVAIIMDGNGRWAKTRGEARTYGHRHAIDAVRDAINACNEVHIPYLTLYTFSTENWNRPADEVGTLMSLLSETLIIEAENIYNKGLRLHVIGDISQLPQLVKDQLQQMMELTAGNKNGNLVLALNYGAQAEILKAVKEIAVEVRAGRLNPDAVDAEVFERHLYTSGMPPVDLMIRTSGEIRISNFLLWQIAYAELQFLDVLWPDFNREAFFRCVVQYQQKERRFGKTSEQLDNQ